MTYLWNHDQLVWQCPSIISTSVSPSLQSLVDFVGNLDSFKTFLYCLRGVFIAVMELETFIESFVSCNVNYTQGLDRFLLFNFLMQKKKKIRSVIQIRIVIMQYINTIVTVYFDPFGPYYCDDFSK